MHGRIIKCTLSLFVSAIFIQNGFSQTGIPINSYQPTPQAFKYLLLKNSEIENNDTINEQILDLVEPQLLDSVIRRKKEHHQLFFVGWFIHAFGDYNWRAVSKTKQKFVGTVRQHSRSGAEEYTEYDINYDLNFHLRKYLFSVFEFYNRQKAIHRQDFRKSHRTDYTTTPFERDTNNIDISRYRLHCELTPARAFRPQLHYLFFPTLPGLALKDHPNFGTDHPSMGFYGTPCLDCNHNCHPELHPYEWVWWLNLHTDNEQDKTWLIGLFYEGSNRFKHWSTNPKTGTITIPFAYKLNDVKNSVCAIDIEHLVFNRFTDTLLNNLHPPATAISAKQLCCQLNFINGNGISIPLRINFKNALITEGLKYWFSDINWDEGEHVLSGYLHLGASVYDLYTTKIVFKNQ